MNDTRKPIAIHGNTVICDDGTMWSYVHMTDPDDAHVLLLKKEWVRMEGVPQGHLSNYPPK